MVECAENCFKGNFNAEYLMNICQHVPELQDVMTNDDLQKKQSL